MKQSSLSETLDKELDPAFRRRARIIFDELAIIPGDKILEVGCGRGFYANIIGRFFPRSSYVGIDINETYLQTARTFAKTKNVEFQKADATKLPFADETFDKILCTEVLEHMENDKKVLSEIYRVLKLKGTILITVPNKNYPFLWDPFNWSLEKLFNTHVPSNIWWLAGIWADHVRLYDEKEIVQKVKIIGFSIKKICYSTAYSLPFAHFILYGIGKNLVERGLISSNFDRFNQRKKTSLSVKITKLPFDLFDQFNNNEAKQKRFLNYIIKAKK